MSFMIEDDSVLVKYNDILNKIKKILNIKFHNIPVYDEKYIKAKVKELNGAVNTNFWGDKVPKEGEHHTYIASISIDSVMKIEKKNYLQVYLADCKHKTQKINMPGFIDVELILVLILNDCNSLLTIMSLTFIQCGDCAWCGDFYLPSVSFEPALQ